MWILWQWVHKAKLYICFIGPFAHKSTCPINLSVVVEIQNVITLTASAIMIVICPNEVDPPHTLIWLHYVRKIIHFRYKLDFPFLQKHGEAFPGPFSSIILPQKNCKYILPIFLLPISITFPHRNRGVQSCSFSNIKFLRTLKHLISASLHYKYNLNRKSSNILSVRTFASYRVG